MKKILLSLLAIVAMGITAKGQISLTQSDFPQAGTSTDIHYMYTNMSIYVGDSITIGAAGVDGAYDLTKLANITPEYTENVNFMAASASPYAANHTGATLAYMDEMEMDGNDTIFIRWNFVKVDANSASIVGITFEIDTASFFSGNAPQGRDVILHATYNNPELLVNTSFAKDYTASSNSHFSVSLAAFAIQHDETYIRNYEVDGYGKFKHPNYPNDEMGVLRVKVRLEEWNIDTVMGVEDDNSKDTTYMIQYWGVGYGIPVATVYTASDYQQVYGASYADITELNTSVARLNPADFNLYPNPANYYATIDFGKVLEANYTLKVYNSLGQVITNLYVQAGTDNVQIDVSTLAKGTYYIGLEGINGEKVLTKKLVVQ